MAFDFHLQHAPKPNHHHLNSSVGVLPRLRSSKSVAHSSMLINWTGKLAQSNLPNSFWIWKCKNKNWLDLDRNYVLITIIFAPSGSYSSTKCQFQGGLGKNHCTCDYLNDFRDLKMFHWFLRHFSFINFAIFIITCKIQEHKPQKNCYRNVVEIDLENELINFIYIDKQQIIVYICRAMYLDCFVTHKWQRFFASE